MYFGILKTGATVVPLNVLLEAARNRLSPARQRRESAGSVFKARRAPDGRSGESRGRRCAFVHAADRACRIPCDASARRSATSSRWRISSAGQPADIRDLRHSARRHGHHSLYVRHNRPAERRRADAYEHGDERHGLGRALCRIAQTRSGSHATAITLPLFHATAQTAQMLAYFHLGGTLVLLPRFEPAALLAVMPRERITHWIGVPTMYWTLLKHVREQASMCRAAAATLRLVVSGGAPMPVELMKDFEKTFGVRIIEGYGLSETAPVASFNHLDRPSKPGTVGQPLFAVDIMIVNDQRRAGRGRPARRGSSSAATM